MKKLLSILFGLVFANYAYQYFAGQHWNVAFERSFFQFTALVIYASSIAIFPSTPNREDAK